MATSDEKIIYQKMREIVQHLVERQYTEIEKCTNGIRMPADEIKIAVEDYGYTLCKIPESGWALIDVVPIENANPSAYSVNLPLWTIEEGRSDLTMEAIIRIENGIGSVQLDGIHVL